MADIEIEIDGKKLTAQPNQTVIQVADEAGIYIPRFCYHKHLSIPANCRMCLVEVEKAPKALPACATPVTPGMKVFTRSQKTLLAQRAVMEFLLVNHPLDCPICDQGGECELQDLSMGYGSSWSHYDEAKRAVADQDLGPLIATEMTRCIYCTRCVRFGDEVAGLREMGAIGRGEFTEIGTYIQHYLTSEVSGNIIDLCPVGALTSKPYRFTARPWELDQTRSVSPHDCVGSNLHIHTRYGKVMRVGVQENTEINQTWISDRDRFSYTGLYHEHRLAEPKIKVNGEWQVVDWQTALETAAAGLRDVIQQHGSDKFGTLATPSSTLEEFYLLQKITRDLDSPHIDHRLRAIDTRDQTSFGTFPGLPLAIDELRNCDAICLIGSNIQQEQPIIGLQVRQAMLKGGSIAAINAVDYAFNFILNAKKIIAPHEFLTALTQIQQHIAENVDEPFAKHFAGKERSIILLGAQAMNHPQAAAIRIIAQLIATATGSSIGYLTEGANSAGAYLAGAVPHRHANGDLVNPPGMNAHEMLSKARCAYLLFNLEPDLDTANAAQTVKCLEQAKFIVAINQYRNEVLEQVADVILPMASFTETSGTFVNACGRWQSFQGNAMPYAEARPGWKILRVLANFLQLSGFEYDSSESIRHEVKQLIDQAQYVAEPYHLPSVNFGPEEKHTISRIGEIPMYAIDGLVRRAGPLQQIQQTVNNPAVVHLHAHTVAALKLVEGQHVRITQHGSSIELPFVTDNKIAQNAAWVAGGIQETAQLGGLMDAIQIEKIKVD